ncbi:UNVERIFIED_CONTAM: hypothetical protein Sradi_3493700 [Sesamum radiatum]|uniref:C2H2-type domain-containing protein n=1 Tax=Sesamum radiatum TaxID=300843 RepID=A0AAW2QDY1_SESRA
MALLTFLPADPNTNNSNSHHSKSKKTKKKQPHQQTKQKQPSSSSWDQIKNLLTCKQVHDSKIHDPSKTTPSHTLFHASSCSSICTFRDVVHANTRVVHRSADNSPEGSTVGQDTSRLLTKKTTHASSSSRSIHSSSSVRSTAGAGRGMQLRKLSGCYECHAIVDPTRYPLGRSSICACPECGEVFPKIESLEHHQAIRHAVSELGPEDSSRNIVEIIFKSSWLKKDNPICKIERILKVHNTRRTIQRFEDYRDAVKIRANTSAKRNARCAADGNELLRFHAATHVLPRRPRLIQLVRLRTGLRSLHYHPTRVPGQQDQRGPHHSEQQTRQLPRRLGHTQSHAGVSCDCGKGEARGGGFGG